MFQAGKHCSDRPKGGQPQRCPKGQAGRQAPTSGQSPAPCAGRERLAPQCLRRSASRTRRRW
eukprot:9480450-Pyramimonas_sp.AAC.1